jgi:inner membrane protein
LDNITHTLVGLVVGETAARATRADPAGVAADTRRNLFVTLMAVGSNVPDLDFIPSRILDSKLNYLLHHRGHTHTIIGALVLSVILYLCCEAWCRWKRRPLSNRDRAQLLGVGLLASLLHIGLDFTNSYGVHPFWPVDNRWYYGDAVFIVEPLFWAASAPLFFLLRSKFAKAFVALALVAGASLSVATGMVPVTMCAVLIAVTIVMLILGRRAMPLTALTTSLVLWFAINAGFMYSSAVAGERVTALATTTFGGERLLDHVLSPMPVNPFCWQVVLVQADQERWFVRRAALALAPQWVAAQRCPSRSDTSRTTAPMQSVMARDTDEIAWINEIAMDRTLLTEWAEKDCEAAAFLRFARAPWIASDGENLVLGDARFDNERELSFAEIELKADRATCMKHVPPWAEPRFDLLR